MATIVGQPCCTTFPLSKLTAVIAVIVLIISVQGTQSLSDRLLNRRNSGGLNIKELTDAEKLSKLFQVENDGYFTDTEQVQVKPFAGINIQNEAQKISANLRWISNEEIGVTAMQVIYPVFSGKLIK